MKAGWRVSIALPVLAGLAFATSAAMSSFSADQSARVASVEMGTWLASGATPSAEGWNSVLAELMAAGERAEDDPGTHELLGILYAMRRDGAEYRQAADVHFKRALALRPTSPYTWANLAEVDYDRGAPNRDIEMAMTNAARLGPGEPEVQRIVVDYGLALWDELPTESRATVERALSAGLRRNPLEMLRISDRRGRLALACRHLAANPGAPGQKWYQLCQSTEATP